MQFPIPYGGYRPNTIYQLRPVLTVEFVQPYPVQTIPEQEQPETFENPITDEEYRREQEERELKKLNIIIIEYGGDRFLTPEECKMRAEEIIQMATGSYLPVVWAIRLHSSNPRTLMIRAKMMTLGAKLMVLRHKNSLKRRQITIDHDFTKQEYQVQRELREVAQRERQTGNNVMLRRGRIAINGNWMTYN